MGGLISADFSGSCHARFGHRASGHNGSYIVSELLAAGHEVTGHDVRRNFVDLLTPAELDMIAALHERVLEHLAEDPVAE